ncbi:MAG: hypothetical protein P4M02_01700 [Clostridia bacterium]|nr:hypothetical protein [Clostridia bacterium]
MEVLEIIGLFFAFGIILLIDRPKLRAAENPRKHAAVYYSVLAVGLLVSILEVFNLIPDLNGTVTDLYKKLTGS